MKHMGVMFCLCLATIAIISCIPYGVDGDTMLDERLALIIVSGYGGYSNGEVNKAQDFRGYLMENNYPSYNIRHLSRPNQPGYYSEATVDKVEESFDWLKIRSSPSSEIMIYISDHVQVIDNAGSFRFNDGSIKTNTIEGWIGEIECASLTIVLTGERSGLGGGDLADPGRAVYCSMKSNQEFNPDGFNITRSLRDPNADLDEDGKVSFSEAFAKEVLILAPTGQEPVKFV